jgi:hypothetical protein
VGDERLIQDSDTGFFDPRLCRRIGARRDIPEQSELREYERGWTLRSPHLTHVDAVGA